MSSQVPVTVVGGVLLVSFSIWLWCYSPGNGSDVERWLDDNKLSQLKSHPDVQSLQTLQDLAKLDVHRIQYVNSYDKAQLELAMGRLKLELWLKEKGVPEASSVLAELGVRSMEGLCGLSSGNKKNVEGRLSASEGSKFKAVLESFTKSECLEQKLVVDTGWKLGDTLWLVFKVVVALAVCGLISVVTCVVGAVIAGIASAITGQRVAAPRHNTQTRSQRRPNTTNTFSLGLYDRIRGSYLDHAQCHVEWNHKDDDTVGGSSVTTIKLICKNSSPYLFQTSDNFQCTVTHTSSSIVVPHVVEPTPLTDQSTLKVSFITRTSGRYSIEVKINGKNVGASPYSRNYTPGPVDASKTVFIDQTAVVVVTKGIYSAMSVIPRDSFGNTAAISQEELTVEIRKNSASGPPVNPECVVERERQNRYELLLKVDEEGYFVSCVKYGGKIIGPPSFSIISLSDNDSQVVEKNVHKKNLNVWYEATLTSKGKTKTVYCYISPRQLQVREYFMKIIPTRVFICKVCPSTRIKLHPEAGCFTIDDSYQEPVTLTSPSRNVLAATFYKFVLKNIGGSEKFQDKQAFFYTELKKCHSKCSRSDLKVVVSRFDLLESARKATKKFGVSDWCRKFVIEFQGEEGLDWGGVSREFFHVLSVECFDVSNNMFTSFNKENMQALVHPNPNRPEHLQLKYFEFAGRLVGKSLYESACGNPLMVKARFTRSFLAQIIGLRINYKYFSTDDPDLYITKIQYIRENDVTDLGVVFAEEEFDKDGRNPQVVPLKENGAELDVTEENKMEYLDLLAQHRLARSVKEEIDAFLKGIVAQPTQLHIVITSARCHTEF